MPSTQNAVNNHEYRSVPITALAESATNPRKRFDAEEPRRTGSLCAQAHKRPFVPLVILWPRTLNGAWYPAVLVPKGT